MSQTVTFGIPISITIEGVPAGVPLSISVSLGQPVIEQPVLQEPMYGPSIIQNLVEQYRERYRGHDTMFPLLSQIRPPKQRESGERTDWKHEGF